MNDRELPYNRCTVAGICRLSPGRFVPAPSQSSGQNQISFEAR